MATKQWRAIGDVIEERQRQDAKWGDQSGLPRERMLAVLMEEVGEVAEAILANGKPRDLRAELVQVAAVAVQMIEHIDAAAPASAGTEGGE